MNINSFFGQNQPTQTPQNPTHTAQNMPPQYFQQGQGQQPQFRPQFAPQTVKPKRAKPKKRKFKMKWNKIFAITKLQIWTVGVVLVCFCWAFLSAKYKTTISPKKAAAKMAISHKAKAKK